ncbi:MBL fold metallo-hydrolase [Nocardioides sp.]|uniref:MBL fold metallo-hydrolase n=1 Tax=Nocardioides sp. TaxID=35761 RepID=UPI002CAA136D|nr:MBL fold metallo-hydrolase [Nocardioides sp.]HXH78752.1 MBL fold metallo-hydrolase [Nocardioides sp.]
MIETKTNTLGGLTIVPIETPTLGDRTYLVHDGQVAFVVDPQRDIDRVTALLDEHQVRLTHVFETHIHNDYVTGGLALAKATGADYLVNAADEVAFDRTLINDGETVEVGERMRLTALATPGHTFTHLSYALSDASATERGGDGSVGVFSGGSLLFGATGRPDLLGEEHTHALVRHQHASAHRLADLLPDETGVFPTHGFGSFCASTQSDATDSTIGQEKESNPALTQDEETYVRELLAGLGAYPAYYAHMAPANAAGPDAADLSEPTKADATELRRRVEDGEWVVDLRNRTAFAAGHAAGTLNFGIDGNFATYLGWLIPWGTPVTLLGRTADDVAKAQREMSRIGIDRPAAHAVGDPTTWADGELASFPTGTFADLAQVRHHRPVVVLDVRRTEEYESARIDGAVNVPLHELPAHVGDVPDGELWVHCASGYRASIAASLLDTHGRALVAINDSFEDAEKVGLHLVGNESDDGGGTGDKSN